MPTLRKDKDGCWMGRVIRNGKTVALKMFSPGKKHGPEWRAAKEWEEEQKSIVDSQIAILSDSERLLQWGEEYLAHTERTMSRKTLVGKQLVMRKLFEFLHAEGITRLEEVTTAKLYKHLAVFYDKSGGSVANKHRKNLLAAWAWGVDYIDGFPQTLQTVRRVKPFPAEQGERYVPPEGDVIKVMQKASGQDLIMLLTLYFTGARRGEVFALRWEDVSLDSGKLRLKDHKGGEGAQRVRWLQMHPELVKALTWWREARPCKVGNVFMQIQCDGSMGEPFRQRRHFMLNLCEKAGVKPFGFHALRHKSAAITFVESGLNAAQILMGHYRATTTDTYVRSAGLYTNQESILSALSNSKIGRAIRGGMLETNFPRELEPHGENCNRVFVTQ